MKKSDIIVCPVCGFSFKLDIKKRALTIKCPMCNHKFGDPNTYNLSFKKL